MTDLPIRPTRRSILAGSVMALGGISVADPAAAEPKEGAFRFAHLTDMHLQPESGAPEAFAQCLSSLAQINPAPQCVITGGDHIRDGLKQTRERCDEQWNVYHQVVRDNFKLNARIFPVIGNHDVWGWCVNEVSDEQTRIGKAIALEKLGLPRGYYSFDAGGWHVVVLDNIQRWNQNYLGLLDPRQLEWLQSDLATNAASGKPVCVISHIPLLSVCAPFFCYENRELPSVDYRMMHNLVHHNPAPLLKLLAANNVKLAISGHIHLLDRFEHLGIHFVCDGAVCGMWWRGPFQDIPPGYGIFDLYPDGAFDYQYITYDWTSPSSEMTARAPGPPVIPSGTPRGISDAL